LSTSSRPPHAKTPRLSIVLLQTHPSINMFNRFKRHSSKTISAQCPRVVRERKVVLCDWGFHGRASNDGWCFTYVDEVDLNPDEDIDCYKQTSLDECGEILVKFVASQLRKNSRLKESKGWRFVCLIEDGKNRPVPLQRRDRTPRTMLLFEREVPCPCDGSQHSPSQSPDYGKPKTFCDEKKGSFSSTAPPTYRSRQSTLATLHEDGIM